jgi:putative pyruvate formate lyase activating enzyme
MKSKIKLIEKVTDSLYNRLRKCDLCPRNCGVNRLKGQAGYCGAGKDMIIYTTFLHQGEEPGVSKDKGSGTIFFSGCNLKCVYCQNYKFSHHFQGKLVSEVELAKIMVDLQAKGACNINLVTPTHYIAQILQSLKLAFQSGLSLPIVYNTSGYEKKEVIEQLEGIVDIYLADLKYASGEPANRYSNAPNYPVFAPKSLRMMARQVRPLWAQDCLKKGLIIRHLVLPGHINESKKILGWIKQNTPQALISVMFQYQPYFKAKQYPQISRKINSCEYQEIKEFVEELGLEGWVQDFSPNEELAGINFSPQLEI